MAKKKVMRRNTIVPKSGVPTLEVVREVRGAREIPQFYLYTFPIDEYEADDDEYDDDEYYHDWLNDTMEREGVFNTEQEAVDEAKRKLSRNRYQAAFCVMQITKVIKAKIADPVIEVL